MGRNHYHRLPLNLERDLNLVLTMEVHKRSINETLEVLNALRNKDGYEAALLAGLPEEEARRQGARAEISRKTLFTLRKKALDRILKPANALLGRQILEARLEDLEMKRVSFEHAERLCWEELANVDSDVIDVTPGVELDNRRGRAPRADPRWMERIESLLWKQVLLGEKITEIRAALSLAPPVDLLEAAGAGDEAAGKGLKLWEVKQLYSPEARAAGITAEEATRRITALSAYLDGKLRGQGGKIGDPGRVTFRVTVAEEGETGE